MNGLVLVVVGHELLSMTLKPASPDTAFCPKGIHSSTDFKSQEGRHSSRGKDRASLVSLVV